jgi:hypothetical protein
MVVAHVDELGGPDYGAEGGFGDGIPVTYEGHDGPVGVGAGVDVKKYRTGNPNDLGGDAIDYGAVAAFREVGDTFDQLQVVSSPRTGSRQTNHCIGRAAVAGLGDAAIARSAHLESPEGAGNATQQTGGVALNPWTILPTLEPWRFPN